MLQNVCRLCLSDNNLGPLFVNTAESENFSAILEITTGLKIEPNDGYPQKICTRCTELVNSALTLRNESHLAYTKLLLMNLDEKSSVKSENIPSTSSENCVNIIPDDFQSNSSEGCADNSRCTEFKIEIQCDRLENGGSSNQDGGVEKISRKKATQTYKEMVDGAIDPKGPVKCKVCKKMMRNWKCFVGHAKLHLQGKNIVCEFCGKGFSSATRLKRHCMSFHGLAREVDCKQCGYLALDKQQLMLHERRVHTGERPYVCDACSAAFHSRKCLLQHIDGHKESADVQCDLCLQKYKSARHLARHRYKAHSIRHTRN